MSQNFISIQKEKGKHIVFLNPQKKNDQSQIQLYRMNTLNTHKGNYTYVKEYRQSKDNKEEKRNIIGNDKNIHNIRKGVMNLKKKIFTIKTNSESKEQLKNEDKKRKIKLNNYRPSFTYTFSKAKRLSNDLYNKNTNIYPKKERNIDNNIFDNGRKKRNANTKNHSFFISNNINNKGYNNINNNNEVNKNKNYRKENKNINNISNRSIHRNNDNVNKNSNSLSCEISKDFRKKDFKYLFGSFKQSHDKFLSNFISSYDNFIKYIEKKNSEFLDLVRYRNNMFINNLEKKNLEFMGLLRYENKMFLIRLEEKNKNLIKEVFKNQREENKAFLRDFISMLNDEVNKKKNKR